MVSLLFDGSKRKSKLKNKTQIHLEITAFTFSGLTTEIFPLIRDIKVICLDILNVKYFPFTQRELRNYILAYVCHFFFINENKILNNLDYSSIKTFSYFPTLFYSEV